MHCLECKWWFVSVPDEPELGGLCQNSDLKLNPSDPYVSLVSDPDFGCVQWGPKE